MTRDNLFDFFHYVRRNGEFTITSTIEAIT